MSERDGDTNLGLLIRRSTVENFLFSKRVRSVLGITTS